MTQSQEYHFEVPNEWAGLRADKLLVSKYPEYSRSQIQRFFSAGLVWRDNQAIIKKQKLLAGDWITFTVPPPRPLTLEPIAIPIEILYEDDDLIVVNKPAGMVVYPGNGNEKKTLVHALLYHCKGKLSQVGGGERPGIVHRLDKDTTGVIIAAKTDRAFFALSTLFAERKMIKEYQALVQGTPREPKGSIHLPIGRHPSFRIKMAVVTQGRPAKSDWEKIKSSDNAFSLLKIHIHTGRTHQIRVHLSHEGYPIVGDTLYGYKKEALLKGKDIRTFLHARRLSFIHPFTLEKMDFTAPFPNDFSQLATFIFDKINV